MNLSQFVQWAIAQGSLGKYNDGQYVGQCVSLINQYCWRVLNVPADAWGNAKDWASNANVMRYFTPVGGTPQSGDILVYGAAYGGGDGHIEIALGNGQALEQNRGWDGRIHQRAILPGYSTILRFKGNIPKEDNVPKIQNQPNWKSRFARLHRQFLPWEMSDEVFNSIVGQDAWTVVENWSDHPNADENIENSRLGALALRDNWQQQIYDRTAERDSAVQERNTARDEAAKYKTESQGKDVVINDLKAQLAVQSDDTKNLNALGQALQWAIVRLGLK